MNLLQGTDFSIIIEVLSNFFGAFLSGIAEVTQSRMKRIGGMSILDLRHFDAAES